MRLTATLVLILLLGACASTAYKDEAAQLGTSASALAAAFPSQAKVDAAGGAVLDRTTDMLMLNGPIRYTNSCGDEAFAAYKAFVGSLSQVQSVQDSAYATLVKSPACSIVPVVSVAAPASPLPARVVGGQAGSAAKPDTAAEARRSAAAMVHSSEQPLPVPVCKGSCTLEDYTNQIKAYGEAIQAASTAQNVSDAQTAVGKADTSIDGLLKAAKASPLAAPITDAVAAVGKLALQEAQYEAMKHAVLSFDSAWPQVSPSVETAARFRQAQLISYLADSSQSTCLSAQLYLNDGRYYRTPAERLQLFDVLDANVNTAAASLKTAEIDPGAAIAAFTKANHTLALAMQDPGRQSTTLLADLNAVQSQISAIDKAGAPAKPASGAK